MAAVPHPARSDTLPSMLAQVHSFVFQGIDPISVSPREAKSRVGWYNAYRPHAALARRTPDEVYLRLRSANKAPRHEPRRGWPRAAPCAFPQALVRGAPGAQLEMHRAPLITSRHALTPREWPAEWPFASCRVLSAMISPIEGANAASRWRVRHFDAPRMPASCATGVNVPVMPDPATGPLALTPLRGRGQHQLRSADATTPRS